MLRKFTDLHPILLRDSLPLEKVKIWSRADEERQTQQIRR